MPEVLEARDWGKRAGKLHPTEAKPADSEVQSQVSRDGRIQQKDGASPRKKRRRSEEEAAFSRKTELGNKQKGKRRRNSASSRKTVQHNSKAWVAQPACNAREKRQELDAQSEPTAV